MLSAARHPPDGDLLPPATISAHQRLKSNLEDALKLMLFMFLRVPIVSTVVGFATNEFRPVNVRRLAALIGLERAGDGYRAREGRRRPRAGLLAARREQASRRVTTKPHPAALPSCSRSESSRTQSSLSAATASSCQGHGGRHRRSWRSRDRPCAGGGGGPGGPRRRPQWPPQLG